MGQQIQCPHCGQAYALSDEQVPQYAGQTINCTQCSRSFTVPRSIVAGEQRNVPPPLPPEPMAPRPAAFAQPVDYAAPYPYATQRRTSGVAIAALVLGICGLFIPFAGILAVALGIIALVQMKQPEIGGKGLAIAGIILGAVTTVFLGTCIGFALIRTAALPQRFAQASEAANRTQCASNLRQLGQAMQMYCSNNNGEYPDSLGSLVYAQNVPPEQFICPSSGDTPAPGGDAEEEVAALNGNHLSYIYVGAGLTSQAGPGTILMYEPPSHHGNHGANFLWADGHVSFETPARAQQLIAQSKAQRAQRIAATQKGATRP